MSLIRVLDQHEVVSLPAALNQAVGFTGLDAWMFFTQRIYKFPIYRLVSQAEDGINGWLALAHVQHPIFGNYLVTSPFGSYGGFGYVDETVRDGLLEKARALTKEVGAHHANVRFEAGAEHPPSGWMQHPNYCTFFIDLSSNPEDLLRSFSSDHRNHIRKSLKKGFTMRFGQLDLLDDVYAGLARSMHELGSPYHSKNYLRAMADALGASLEFAVLYDADGSIAGAGVFVFHGALVVNLHANILRDFRSNYAGEFLYWSVMERYCQRGVQVFDLGRSLIGSGNETFKMKWRPRRQLLAYWYALMDGASLPELNQKNPKFQLVIKLWQHMPAFLVRWLGPYLINGLA